MTIKERKKFILDNFKNYEYNLNETILIDIRINIFRRKNNLPDLIYIRNSRLPDFILNEPSIMKLFVDQNIYKLSNKEYLFKYPINEIKNKFMNKDKNILDILRKDILNRIEIIIQGKIEYVYIYDYSYNDYKSEINSLDYGFNINNTYNEDISFSKINSNEKYFIE